MPPCSKNYWLELRVDKDFLWLHLKDLPYFRAMLRAVEARFFQDLVLPSPTLDIGCGDGHFALTTFNHKIDVGLDPDHGTILEAAQRSNYLVLIQGDAGELPFPTGYFASAVSNSVLEHIPHLEYVIREASRVLKPGAHFYFCVPNHRFNASLSLSRWLSNMGFPKLAAGYQHFYDRLARHIHLDSPGVWQNRLEEHGFEMVASLDYFSPQALRVLEWGHLFGIPSLLIRKITGRWILMKKEWNFVLIRPILQRYYDEGYPHPDGVCTFFVARKL